MCGIAGIWRLDGSQLEQANLKKFTDTMQSRGPDGNGYKVFDDVALGFGHRRLSILDMSENGAQPFVYNNRYWITYNGEVYNFLEIREELKKSGYKFFTETDTEVILAAYEKWGLDCFLRFNGMWAIAIYDVQEKKLILSRDRFGVKPLYFLHKNNLFAFASETIAFKQLDGYKREFSAENVLHGILRQNLLEASGKTIFNDIVQLPPGHLLIIDKTQNLKVKRWWFLSAALPQVPKNYDDKVQQARELFESACKLRLRSDVPVASALSGGLDSSSVYCMVHYLMKRGLSERVPAEWQKAFVATFPGTSQDERSFAEQVIQHIGGAVRYIPPDYSNLWNDIHRETVSFDAVSTTPLVCLTPVYKAMRDAGIKVSMDGHGLDEIMYGYPSSVSEAYFDAVNAGDASYIKDLEDTYFHLFPQEIAAQRLNTLKERAARQKQYSSFKQRLKQRLSSFTGPKPYVPSRSLSDVTNPGEWFNVQTLSPLTLSEYYESESYPSSSRGEKQLVKEFHFDDMPYNLRDFDRGAMQNSIEIRMPFMDWRFVAFCFALDTKSKLGKGYTKRVMRDALKDVLPESIRTRKLKIGLSSPLKDWFSNELNAPLMEMVNSAAFTSNPFFNGKEIKSFIETRCREKNWNHADASMVWPVINFYIVYNGSKGY